MDRQAAGTRVKGVSVCGESLRQLRIARGMTQMELARVAGYSERLIRKAEAGGSLSLTTIEDLADALSCHHKRITTSDLCSSPEAIARSFVECYDEHEQLMLDYCGHLLADDFVFHCAGEEASNMAGEWRGVTGFQAWLDQLFSIVSRPQRKCLQASYMAAEERVVAHYSDTFVAADHSQHVMWVNLHFTIRDGRIERIDDEFDTSLAIKIEKRSRLVEKPLQPR